MDYLLNERIFYILLAGVVGAIVGWLLSKLSAEKKWAARYQLMEESNHHVESLLNTSEERSLSLNEKAQILASQLALKTSDNHTLVKAFSGIQDARNNLKEQLKKVNLKSRKVQALYAELKDRNIKLGNRLDQALKDRNTIKQLERSIVTVNTTNSNLQQELIASKDIHQKNTTAIESLESEKKDFHLKYKALDSSFSDLQSQASSTEQDNKQYKEQLKESFIENKTLKNKLLSVDEKIAAREKKITNLQKKKEESDKKYSASFDEIQRLNLELEQSQTRINDSANQLQQLHDETEKEKDEILTTQIATLTSERNQLSKDLAKNKTTATSDKTLINTLQNQIKTSESENLMLSKKLEKNKQLTQELSNLQVDFKNLELDKEKLQASLHVAQQRVSSMLGLEKKLVDIRKEMSTNETTWNSEIERHESYLMKSETRWASETKSLQDKLDSLNKKYKEATEKATERTKASKAKIAALTIERNNLTKVREKADIELKLAAENNSRHISSLENKIKNLSQELQNLSEDQQDNRKISPVSGTTHSESSINKLISNLDNEKKQVKNLTLKVERLKKEHNEERSNLKSQPLQSKTETENSRARGKSEDIDGKKKAQKIVSTNSNKAANHNKHSTRSKSNKMVAVQKSPHSQPKIKNLINSNPARYPIEAIEGIGVVYGKRFRNINVNFVDTLLSKGKDPAGRKSLTERTDINKDLILTWVNHADLFRIDGVEGDYAELLEASGVDTVKELRNRNANNLVRKMTSVNEQKRLAPKPPEESDVTAWIAQAGQLKPMLTYSNSSTTASKEKTTTHQGIQLKDTTNESTANTDDLKKIDGIGKVNEKKLHSLGIRTFAQIAKFTQQDEKTYGAKLSSFHGRITKEQWVKQAKELHRVTYGKNA